MYKDIEEWLETKTKIADKFNFIIYEDIIVVDSVKIQLSEVESIIEDIGKRSILLTTELMIYEDDDKKVSAGAKYELKGEIITLWFSDVILQKTRSKR